MNQQKTFLLILFSYLFLLGCNSSKKERFPIPADADLVAKVDLSRIAKKVALNKMEEFNLWDLFSSPTNDSSNNSSGLEQIIAHPGDAGIDYLDEIYLFHRKNKFYLIARVEDQDKLEQFCQSIALSKVDYKKKIITDSSFSIHYNKDFLIANILQEESLDSLQNLLNLSQTNSFFSEFVLAKMQHLSSDILAFYKTKELLNENTDTDYLNLFTDSLAISQIDFEDGKVEITMESLFQSAFEIHINSINKELIQNLNKENTLAFSTFHLELDSNSFLPKRPDALSEIGINPINILQSVQGEIQFHSDTIMMMNRIFKSYSFDDDFNKIETIDSSIIYYPHFTLTVPFKEDQSITQLLNQLSTRNILNKRNENSYQFDLSDVPLYVTTDMKTKIVTISDLISPITTSKSCINSNCISDSICFFSYVNFKKLPSKFFKGQEYLKELDVTGIKNNKGKIKLSINLYLTDSNKNSLLTLMELIKKVNSKFS